MWQVGQFLGRPEFLFDCYLPAFALDHFLYLSFPLCKTGIMTALSPGS